MIDLEFLNQNTLHRLTITEYLKLKQSLPAEPTVSTKPYVSCAEASWSVLEFQCYSHLQPTQPYIEVSN